MNINEMIDSGMVKRHHAREIAGENGFDITGGYHDDENLIREAEIVDPENWEAELAEYCREIVEYNKSLDGQS